MSLWVILHGSNFPNSVNKAQVRALLSFHASNIHVRVMHKFVKMDMHRIIFPWFPEMWLDSLSID